MARLVDFLVVGALHLSIALGRDHELFSCRKQRLDHALIGIESFVRQQGIGLHLGQERVGSLQVMGLAGSQEKRTDCPMASTMA